MDAKRWGQIKEIYDRALDLCGDERESFLAEACGGDDDLRREVESLLAAHDDAGTFLQAPAIEVVAREIVADEFTSTAAAKLPATPQLIERELANYKIISLLGRGGMGEVYLAEDKRLHRKVALKLLPAQFMNDAERVRRFEREAAAASAINHPNIVTIHEIGQIEQTHFLVTEFVAGETLRHRLTRGRMEAPAALEVGVQVAAALDAAHEAGIVHRDIKPENVMVRPDGLVKVLDFGLAKLTERATAASEVDSQAETMGQLSTESGAVMGTVSYMSPEQARGEKVDARTDIFSLGVMLYEMVTGRAPFTGATSSEVIAAILRDEPAPLTDDAPQEMARIIGQALRKVRAERYQSVKDLLIDLKDLKRELEIEARLQRPAPRAGAVAPAHVTNGQEPGPTTPAQSTAYLISEIKRHKKGIAALLVVFAIAAAGGGVGLYRLITLRHPRGAGPPMRVVPFTTFDGNQLDPAFSPDGNQIAFSWDSEKRNNYDI